MRMRIMNCCHSIFFQDLLRKTREREALGGNNYIFRKNLLHMRVRNNCALEKNVVIQVVCMECTRDFWGSQVWSLDCHSFRDYFHCTCTPLQLSESVPDSRITLISASPLIKAVSNVKQVL